MGGKSLWKENPGIGWQEHYLAVELSKMRQLMRYGEAQYREDWQVAVACAQLMAMSGNEHLKPVMEGCLNRVRAYLANNPDARPF